MNTIKNECSSPPFRLLTDDHLAKLEDDAFNRELSNWVVLLTFYLILIGVAYIILRLFYRSYDLAPVRLSTKLLHHGHHTINTNSFLPRVVNALAAGIVLGSILLVPLTLISHEVIIRTPNNYYVQWLQRELIHDLWNWQFIGSSLTTWILIPFGYFYHEAEGLGGNRGILARIYESIIVFVLMAIILGGFLFLAQSVVAPETSYIRFSYSLISFLGAISVLVSTPKGFTTMTSKGFNMRRVFISEETLNSRRMITKLELQVFINQLNDPKTSKEERIEISEKMKPLQIELEKLRPSRFPFLIFLLQNFASFGITVSNLLLPAFIVLHTIMRFAKEFTTSNVLFNFLLYEEVERTYLGSLGSIVEFTVVCYLIMATILGFYSGNYLKVRPKKFDTSIHKITLNILSLQLLASSFPFVVRNLGLTSFDLMGYYHDMENRTDVFLPHIFKIAFVIVLGHQYLKLFPGPQFQFRRFLRNFLVRFAFFREKFGLDRELAAKRMYLWKKLRTKMTKEQTST